MRIALDTLELREAWIASDPSCRWRLSPVLAEDRGISDCAVIYFELDSGRMLATHRDSAEELVHVLSGSAAARVGTQRVELKAGEILVIAEGVPHSIRNIGGTPLRAMAYFATPNPVSTFDSPVMPSGERVRGSSR